MLDFDKFKHAIAQQFDKLTQHDMFRTGVEKDQLWETYLKSFPEGTNPVFRKRSEYDCSCCRQFIRAIGNVVAVIDGEIVSIWDVTINEPAYQTVVNALSKLAKSKPIENQFLHSEWQVGVDKNFENADGRVRTWKHFYVTLPRRNQGKTYHCPGVDIATKLGETHALHDVLLRSLSELTRDSIDTVLELIGQNSLYRGAEHKHAVEAFSKLKKEFDKLPAQDRDVFVWAKIDSVPGSVSKIRNTSIGTLLIDLSADMGLEEAVRKFEAMVAPTNYKRPTALVTKSMVEAAKKQIEQLGLTSALERRYARLSDISINNIIFANREAKKALKGDVFDSIATKNTADKNLSKVETVQIEKFIEEIVPKVDSIEVFVENRHSANLVSLIAPVEKTAQPLFKWSNNFSWSYNGDVTDSIKERVKKAGGNVTGDLCCRLAWFNYDDLDFHMKEPNRYEIYFGNKRIKSPSGGMLDVDMNAGGGITREPVENIFYVNRRTMKEGVYELLVHQFSKRESTNVGFEVEIDYLGDVKRYAYEKAVRSQENVLVAKFSYTHQGGMEIIHEGLSSSSVSRKIWNLTTQDFHKVNVLMKSPNYWDNEVGIGNKHYFFMLDACQNDGQARGFFNEFLRSDLDKHRKVIEIVGSKMKTQESAEQLSGIGFSDTKRSELLVRVKGNFTRTLKVMI